MLSLFTLFVKITTTCTHNYSNIIQSYRRLVTVNSGYVLKQQENFFISVHFIRQPMPTVGT